MRASKANRRVCFCSLMSWICAVVFASIMLPAALATDRPHVFGIGTAGGGWTLLNPPGYEDAKFDRMAQAGAASTRTGASWADIESTRGVYDWSDLDSEVAACRARGIEPYCLIVNTPQWALLPGQEIHAYPPQPQYEPDFQAFCTALAARYRGRITFYEFWNEQNGYGWHTDGGFNRVDEYVPFLRLAYNALKAGDPECVVAIGGLDDPDISPGDPTGWRGANFMRLFYDELDRRGWSNETIFDAVADHPYHSRQELGDLRHKLRALHGRLAARGDADKPVWITEYGWTTKSDEIDDETQAQLFHDYLSILLEPEFTYVTMASCLAIADWETGYDGWGLTDQNLRPKLSYYAFQSYPRSDAPQVSHVDWHPLSRRSIEVTWRTHIPATSQIEYGPTAAYGSRTPLDEGLVTEHSAQVVGLTPGQVCHFRVLATAPDVGGSASADFTWRCPDVGVPNAGFDDGIGPGIGQWWWTIGRSFYTTGAGLNRVRTGAHSQAVVEIGNWGNRYMDDAVYTFAGASRGQPCVFSAFVYLDVDTDTPDTLAASVGADPAGGTDFNAPSVVWSAPTTSEDGWRPLSVSFTPQAPVVTLFVRGDVLIPEPVWYSMYIDDTSLAADPAFVPGDFDNDRDVDQSDFGRFQVCLTGPGAPQEDPACIRALLDDDNDVDAEDLGLLRGCTSGASVPADPDCAW